MSVFILRPDSDIKADATEVPAGAAWSCLDDNVTQPSSPDTTDYVYTTNYDSWLGTRCTMTTATLDGPVTQVILWAYVETSANDCGVMIGFMDSAGAAVGSSKTLNNQTLAKQWVSLTDVEAGIARSYWTQTTIDGLRGSVDIDSGVNHFAYCYAMYIEVRTGSSVFRPICPHRGLVMRGRRAT